MFSGGLFGTQSSQTGGGLFGTQSSQTSGGLFGTQSSQTGGGLFGTQQPTGGLFGTQSSQTGGLFGTQQSGGLFGTQQSQQSQQSTAIITTTQVKIPTRNKTTNQDIEIKLNETKEEKPLPEKPKTNFIVTQTAASRGSAAKRAAPPASFMSLMMPVLETSPSNPISLSPSYEEICGMDIEEPGAVNDFKVFRKGSVMVEFNKPVSLIGVNISKVFDFGVEGSVRVYNVPSEFLDVPCTVTFYNCGKSEDVSELKERYGDHFDLDTNTLKLSFSSLRDFSRSAKNNQANINTN